ncbi:MAG TPA: hypothetical protein VNB94_05540 [Mycobacteriales bacterium]|nr:hypothetical protein [Mycobacteriales bacterium]
MAGREVARARVGRGSGYVDQLPAFRAAVERAAPARGVAGRGLAPNLGWAERGWGGKLRGGISGPSVTA